MQNTIHISATGIALFKTYEPLGPSVAKNRAYPYVDSVGKPTVGYGHVIQSGENFSNGLAIPSGVDELLLKDLAKYVMCAAFARKYAGNAAGS